MKKDFLLDFMWGERFLLEMEQFHDFWGYRPALKQITVNHFVQEKIPRQTIYSIIRKYEESGYVGDKPRSGRPRKLSCGQLMRLKRLVNKRTGISLRRLASRFKVSYQTVFNHLKAMGIRYYKKNNEHKNIPINNLKRSQLVPDDYIACCRTLILN